MELDYVDHYLVLGLPSGEEGAKLSEKEISKAYRLKALELHPDKRPDNPNAHQDFQNLQTSYEILKDENARKLFHDLLRVKREKVKYTTRKNDKDTDDDTRTGKMARKRERAAYAPPDPCVRARKEEERIARKLKEEIERIRAMQANKIKQVRVMHANSKGWDGIRIVHNRPLKKNAKNNGLSTLIGSAEHMEFLLKF